MNKHILVFGAGRSATSLINYLKLLLVANNWTLTIADNNLELAASKTGNAPHTCAIAIDVHDDEKRTSLVASSDLVISLLPPSLHFLVALDCCRFKKHLLTASYISEDIRNLAPEIESKRLLFLCEMGLDPGIDHMSAMQIIDRLKTSGAVIHSFKSHCGGLIAPESDNNPWHYKISWNAENIVKAGSAGARFKEGGGLRTIYYENLFNNCEQVDIQGLGRYAFYPNRDSLSYMPVYGLEDCNDFLRTTLRHPSFCVGWHAIVSAGLTSAQPIKPASKSSFKEWSKALKPFVIESNKNLFEYLGFFDDALIPGHLTSSAAVLQYLLEKHLMLGKEDHDMIIMQHEFMYSKGAKKQTLNSLLVVKGEDHVHTAMAKTVGLPLGIAAKLVLQGQLTLTGLHIPVLKEIYEPVLEELRSEGITFSETLTELN